MAEFDKQVVKVGSKSKGKNVWTVITTIGKGGKEYEENVFDKDVASVFKEQGTGVYKIVYEQEGKYWNVMSATMIKADSKPPARREQASVAPAQSGKDHAMSLRCTMGSYCVEATGRIVASLVATGAIDKADVKSEIEETFSRLTEIGREFVIGKKKEDPVKDIPFGDDVPEPTEPPEEEMTEVVGA